MVEKINGLAEFTTGGRRSPFPLTFEESGGRPWYQLSDSKKDEIYKSRGLPIPEKIEEQTKPQE